MKRVPFFWRGLLLSLCWAELAAAQAILATTNPERKGSGNLTVSYQSYYNRVNGSPGQNIQGASVLFRQFYPQHGLLSLQGEPLVSRGDFAAGQNYFHWTGLPWKGRHWDFAAGDFRTDTALVEAPFTNLPQPELSLRGAKAVARTDQWQYSFYGGLETLSQGNRVPYRVRVPQSALGVEAAGSIPEKIEVGFRFLRLASSPEQIAAKSIFFPANRQFTQSASLTSQASLRLTKTLQWYTEAGWNHVAEAGSSKARPSPFSLVFGPAWRTTRLAVQAHYSHRGAGYLPVLGYYLGDRRGPNVEAVLRLGRLGVFGNWLQSRNNLERNSEVPDFFSRQSGGGMNFRFPLNFYLSGSISKIRLESSSSESGLQRSANRQYQLMVSRPLFRHNLHATWQRTDIAVRDSRQRLQLFEVEDNYTWRRFTAGGAVRLQRSFADQRRDSLFFRTSGQMQSRRLSMYGYWEHGKDLANATLFATNISSTSVAGLSWEDPRRLGIRVEAFRNHLNSVFNPENLFVLSSRGIIPDSLLTRTNDWSLYIQVTRQLEWGEPLTVDTGGAITLEPPLTGTLAGMVKLRTLSGEFGAADVWVVLDSGRSAKTDANGYYQFPEVPQGVQRVALDMDRLPADFNPTEQREVSTLVRPEQLARVELEVTPLQSLEGNISDAEGNPAPEGIVVRLTPGDLLTTTDQGGRFGFYNLPEGDYVAEVMENSLPESARLVSSPTLSASIRYGAATTSLQFQYAAAVPDPKPVKKVLSERKQTTVRAVKPPADHPTRKGRIVVRTTAPKARKNAAAPHSSSRSVSLLTSTSPTRQVLRAQP